MSTFNLRTVNTINGVISVEGGERSPSYFIDCTTVAGQIDALNRCDVLRTVLGKSAQAIAHLKVWALDEDGRQVKTAQSKKVLSKLMRPNPKEDFKRWFRKLDNQCKLHGHAYVHKSYSKLFDEYDYHIIPFQFVTEMWSDETDSNFERKVKKYIINDSTGSYELKPENVHIFKDVSADTASGDYRMNGGSRLNSLSEIISTYVVLWEVLTEMYGNRGALNLISLGVKDSQMMGLPKTQIEKESVLKRLGQRFGLLRNQDKNVVVSTDAKVHPLTAKMSDMEFASIIIECKKAIGASYDTPAPLLDIESSRYKNMTEAIKNFYTNSAIPTAEYYFSEWLQMTGETSLPFEIKADYSHLEFYKDALKEDAIGFQQMANGVVPLIDSGIITVAEARLKLDME